MQGWTIIEALVRNWAMVAIASSIVILVVVPAIVLLKYVRIALNIMRTARPPLSPIEQDLERSAGEPVHFLAGDGRPVAGMLLRSNHGQPARGLILFAHEYCADMHSCTRYCRPLLDGGYDILTFDFRGHGQTPCPDNYTPRQWITSRDLDDMRGAVAYAERWLAAQQRPVELGVFGISRGGCAAILTAAENPRIQAVVADGAFSTDTTIEYFMRRWADIYARVRIMYENNPPAFWRFMRYLMISFARREFRCEFPSVRKAIQRMTPRPILLIHGEKDSYLPVNQSRLLYALAPQPKTLWVAPNARHNQAVRHHPERYAQLTVGFFDRYLGGHANLDDRAGQAAAAYATAAAGPDHAFGSTPR